MRYIARAPLTLSGRDYRPGDVVDEPEGDAGDELAAIEAGHLEPLATAAPEQPKKRPGR